MGIGEPSLSSSQPFSIFSFGWLRVKVSNLLCFYAFSALLLLAFWFSIVKAPLAFVFYILWILGLILHKQTLLKNPRGDLSHFCIFGPCRKTSPTFWRLRWGVKLLTQEKWCLQRGGTSKEMVFLTPTCHSKGNCMMFYHARRALWSWAWKSSILSSLRYWRWSDSCNKIASTFGNHPRSEGRRDYQLSYSRKKNFFHSSILYYYYYYYYFFSYHSYEWIIIYLLLYMIFVKIFVAAWKCKNGEPQIQQRREWWFQPIINNAKL